MPTDSPFEYVWETAEEVKQERMQEPADKYAALAQEIGTLTDQKNAAYGDSFHRAGDILRILFPDGVKPEQYSDVLAITRVVDKLFRIANKKDAFGESPWRDIVGYALLGAALTTK